MKVRSCGLVYGYYFVVYSGKHFKASFSLLTTDYDNFYSLDRVIKSFKLI